MPTHDHDLQHREHDHSGHAEHSGGVNAMAASAPLHCLTGGAIGEISGLVIGTALGLGNARHHRALRDLGVHVRLPALDAALLGAGRAFGSALTVVLAADTLSIATMEVVDNLVMALIPGAMNAGLVDVVLFGILIALTAAFIAAYPVDRHPLQRGTRRAVDHVALVHP